MLESITRQIFAGIKSRQVRRRDLDEVGARRAALNVAFPFLLRLVGAAHPSIRVLVQIGREIGRARVRKRQSNASKKNIQH